jgi:hypothetical protein
MEYCVGDRKIYVAAVFLRNHGDYGEITPANHPYGFLSKAKSGSECTHPKYTKTSSPSCLNFSWHCDNDGRPFSGAHSGWAGIQFHVQIATINILI